MNSADRPMAARAASVFRLKPLARALSGLAGLMPVIVWAQLPTGAEVVAGSATVTTPGVNHMVVEQGSAKAILNWQQFSIGEQGYVQFIQPGASAIALNRVVGADPSAILGRLSANGQVFLVNPNGVFFGAGARVDVGGIVATTLDIANQDFLNGDYKFERAPGRTGGATVVNAGVINTAEGGYVVLAGDYAANQGVIQTQAGTALLASGKALTLQLSGSGLVDFAVNEAAVVELAGVDNAGQILANGGRVIMTAKVANQLAATVVNNTGLVQAQSTVEKNGVVYLVGEGGSVANAGTLDASAQAGANGGYVEMRSTHDLVSEAGSRVAVSGADTGTSNAGEVYTWADGTNRFKAGAKIEGKGGANGGDGAAVELSGRSVQLAGDLDLRATNGKGGSILIDPLHITIASQDNTAAGGSTVGELWIENQLNAGTDITILADGGAGASITLADLADGVLDGTHASGTGGSLTLRASGAGSSITFANTANTIRVDRNLTLDANNGSGGHTGTTITAGHLIAGQGTPSGGGHNNNTVWNAGLTLNAGTITAQSLTLGKAISSSTDSAYTLMARAHSGDLTVNGNVTVEVTNITTAAAATDLTLRSDNGAVNVTGNVASNATGRGYYHHTWTTAGNNAPTYFGAQPWTQTHQGEHAVDAKLNIQAGGDVNIGGNLAANALDLSANFAGNGGSFQSATGTQHIFWRATAADAAATITAGGNVGITGTTTVVADGYANASYGETESWDRMVSEVNLISQNQQIYQTYGDHDSNPATPNQWYNPQSVQVTTTGRGSNTGNWTWSQSGQNASGAGPYSSANLSPWSTGDSGTQSTAMSYTSQPGLTATLAINADGNVTLNGIDNRAVNRSNTSSSSYTDANWGYQNTAGAAQTVSSSQERRYSNTFSTQWTAAPATASTSITAGDNRSVTLNGGSATYHVEGEHTALNASSNTLAHATMTVTAGSAGGASGDGLITLGGPITVQGSSSNEVHLTVTNHDGAIDHTGGPIAVRNQTSAGVARAAFNSAVADIDLGAVAVSGGHTAYFSAAAAQNLTIAGLTSATGSNLAQIDLDSTNAEVNVEQAVTATANSGIAAVTMDGATGVSTRSITASGSTSASIDLTSSAADVTSIGTLSATATAGSGTASVDLAGATGVTVDNITATATGYSQQPTNPYSINAGGTATVDIESANGNVAVNGNVTANAHRRSAIEIAAGDELTLGAGTTVSATTASSATTSLLTYESLIELSGATGLTANGNVTATASRGTATTTVNTTGGSSASINQGAASIISASGVTASTTIQAGSSGTVNAGNAAALNLGGTVRAQATTGTATLAVRGGNGTLNHFGATSTGNAATATLTGYNAADALTLTGTGTVTGNSNTAMGAALSVVAFGDIASGSSANIQVSNTNTGALAGADAAFVSTSGGIGLGGVQASTAGNGAVGVNAVAGDGDMTASGTISATAQTGTASVALVGTGETRTNAVSASSTGGTATVALNGLNGLELEGNVSAISGTSTASAQLTSNDGTVTTADGTTLTVNGHTGATLQVQAASIDLLGNAAVTASQNNAGATLTGSGDVTVDGNLFVTATIGNASINASSDGLLTLGDEADLRATAGGSTAGVTLVGATGMQLDGDVLAQANAGTATVTAYTDGGNTASVGQGSDSVLRARGLTASLAVGAGNTANAVTSSDAAALDLQGELLVQASTGIGSLAVAGAGGAVNAFSVTSTGNSAEANIAALVADELLELTGIGFVTGSHNSVNGAGLSVTSAGALDAGQATLSVSNTSAGNNAGAYATLGASGLLQLGGVAASTSGNESVAVNASGNAIEVDGALSTSARAGGSTIDLIAATGDVSITADGSMTANALAGTAAIVVNAVAGIDNQGAISADSATGSASVLLRTTGGTTAAIGQGTDGSINASGAMAAVTIQAGGSLPVTAAALALAGSITVDASAGDAQLTVDGSGGNITDFAVTAAAGSANATLTSHDSAGILRLLGEGQVQGDDNSANGAALTVTSAGRLNAGGADITISNVNTGANASATATFDANGGALQLGTVAVSSLGNGLASLNAEATGTLGATNVSAGGHTASVMLHGGGNVNLGDVTANASSTATIDVTSTGGNITQLADSDLNATSSTGNAGIALDAAGAVELRNANASGVQARVDAIARNGALSQAAGSTVQANGSSTAVVELISSGAMTLDGSVLAASTGNNANVSLEAASITQGANGSIAADANFANVTLDADGAVVLGGLLRVDGNYYATATVEGGSIQLNALDVDSGEDAIVTLTSASGIALNGNATIDGGESADFTATAQNGSLTQAAGTSLRVGAIDDATVTLTSSGAMTLNGSVQSASTNGTATTDVDAASITQGANGSLGASGRFADLLLDAGGAINLSGLLSANATGGHAVVDIDGGSIQLAGLDVDASHNASATLTSASIALTGNATIDGGESADFTATAQNGILTQAAGTSLRAGAGTRDASVTLASTGAMTVDGSVQTASTNGAATTTLTAASITQGANGAIGANGSAAALTSLTATGALALDGLLSAGGAHDATLTVNGSSGRVHDINLNAAGTATANITTGGDLLLTGDAVSVNGATAHLIGQAGGALHVAAGASQQANASGSTGTASVKLTSGGAMTIDGNLRADSPAYGAEVVLNSGTGLSQGAGSTIASTGNGATLRANAGGALALDGLLRAQGGQMATLQINGGAGQLRNFDVAASNGLAVATINSSGALVLNGNGRVSGNADDAIGSALVVDAAGALDTRGATLAVDNVHQGGQAGARAVFTSGGELQAGPITVAAAGGEDAILALLAGGALRVNTDLTATANNTGNGQGGALVHLASGQAGNAGDIRQEANTQIRAISGGNNAGDATVLIEAGQCCDGKVELLGTTTARVSGGEGDATIRVHGSTVAVGDLTAKVDGNGRGDTLIALAAPTTVTVNGMLDSQAASSAATAGITLVTNKLDYRATKATLSKGNGRVQLAPFNTTYIIGVESEPDFDTTPQVNYDLALLQKFDNFDNNSAKIVFGGEYDRSSWVADNGTSCVAGMDQWKDIGQHTGEIHVAGAAGARLRLMTSTMVFDTTGTTYYHDNQMSPWSVPTGRTAIYVPRPTASLDRYLDRTDNSIQTTLFGVESATKSVLYTAPMPMAPEGSVPLAGNMFMVGDGVNLSRADIGGTSGGGAGLNSGSGSGSNSAAGGKSQGSGAAATGGNAQGGADSGANAGQGSGAKADAKPGAKSGSGAKSGDTAQDGGADRGGNKGPDQDEAKNAKPSDAKSSDEADPRDEDDDDEDSAEV